MKKFTALAALVLLLSVATFGSRVAFALPSVQDVETSMTQRNWQQADSQLGEVLAAHPKNARAHYLYGQVLEREGRSTDALAQIEQAKTLDPSIRFTDPARFASVERSIRANAGRVATGNIQRQRNTPAIMQQTAPATLAAPPRHGPSAFAWLAILVVIAAVVGVLVWTVRRNRANQDGQATDQRRAQLKRATDLLNAVRSLKLDIRLSTDPGHEALEKETEGVEAQLRETVESLSASQNPVPEYRLDELERQVASLKARSEGRPDPALAPQGSEPSPYALEADRFGRTGQSTPPAPPQPVIMQQPGGGMGGMLTGVLLGSILGGGRDRVVERDVLVDDDSRRRGDGGNIDFGQGGDNWNDGGGIDVGSNDDSGGWSDT